MFKTAYIDSIREYVPEAAKVVLDEQVQKVRQQIADDVAAFGAKLRETIEGEVKSFVDAAQKEALAEVAAMKVQLASLTSNDDLKKATAKLGSDLDAFVTKWSGFGEKVGAAVKSAAAKALAL